MYYVYMCSVDAVVDDTTQLVDTLPAQLQLCRACVHVRQRRRVSWKVIVQLRVYIFIRTRRNKHTQPSRSPSAHTSVALGLGCARSRSLPKSSSYSVAACAHECARIKHTRERVVRAIIYYIRWALHNVTTLSVPSYYYTWRMATPSTWTPTNCTRACQCIPLHFIIIF